MKNLIILTALFFSLGSSSMAQEKSSNELNGDKHFFIYSFDEAIVAYSNSEELTPNGQRNLAESYKNLRQNTKSEEAYAKLITYNVGVIPEDYYKYARILKINGKTIESNKAMDKFVEKQPADLRAKDYVAHNGELNILAKNQGKYKVINQTVNTSAEDLAPCFYKDQVVYASSLAKAKMVVRKSNWTGNPFYSLYISEVEDGQLMNPKIFSESLNGKMHDGPASFSKDGNYMAFTSNNYDLNEGERAVELEIQFSNYVDKKWSDPEGFYLNNKDYSVGHPCLTADGKTMYFTSDMPGGYGGADIYIVKRSDNGKWGNAQNMGDLVNTEGDETFPFYEEISQTLYFTSDGRYGLGGLDIFVHNKAGRTYNPGAPLNTIFDDYALIVNDGMTQGYFSSNRDSGKGSEDIYAFELTRAKEMSIEIAGISKDGQGNKLPSTFITLMDDQGNPIETFTTSADASFSFKVESNKNYKLSGAKAAYTDGLNTANTFTKAAIVKADITLFPKMVSEITASTNTLFEVPKTDNIYFDLGKSNLSAEAVIELDKLVKRMNENPDMHVQLRAHTDCRASENFNQELSERRAKVPAWYIKTRISNSDRVSSKGFGETELVNNCLCEGEVVSGCSEQAHQYNRRTEFVISSGEILP